MRGLANRIADLRLGLPGKAAARRATQAVYLGDGLAVTRVLGRYKMFVPTRDMSVGPHLLMDGRWEPWVTRAIAARLRPGMICADVGANLGIFTLMMADRVGPTGHVHAFEPNPALARLIARSANINSLGDRLTVHETPLGAEEGREMLFVVPGDWLGGGAVWEAGRAGAEDARPVTLRRLDAIPGAEAIDLVKIDAEGLEAAIWDGMAGLVAGPRLRTVFLEFTAAAYPDPAGFLASTAAAGFRLSIVDERRGVVPIAPAALLALPSHLGPMLVLER